MSNPRWNRDSRTPSRDYADEEMRDSIAIPLFGVGLIVLALVGFVAWLVIGRLA